jgi:hypothetical protein
MGTCVWANFGLVNRVTGGSTTSFPLPAHSPVQADPGRLQPPHTLTNGTLGASSSAAGISSPALWLVGTRRQNHLPHQVCWDFSLLPLITGLPAVHPGAFLFRL